MPMKVTLAAALAVAIAMLSGPAAAEDGVLSVAAESGPIDTAGTVDWSAGTDASGLPTVIAVARFDDAFTVRLEMRRNAGGPVPASHLIVVEFSPDGNFGAGGISAVLRITTKANADESGTAFVGAIAPTGQNTFMLAMNDRPAGVERNTSLVAGGALWDLVLVDDSARTVVVTLEVGESGAGIVAAALAAWAGK